VEWTRVRATGFHPTGHNFLAARNLIADSFYEKLLFVRGGLAMGRTTARLAEREEVRRSAVETSRIELKPVDTDRYLDPPADTMHGLEYAFSSPGRCAR